MTKTTKRTLILTTIVCLIPIIAGILLYDKLPNEIVTHWDAQGNPNGWSSKFVGAILFPGILVIINILYPFLLKIDPVHKNQSDKVKNIVHWIIPLISLFASSITLAAALGADVKIELYAPLLMGFIFTILGNYLPKMKQSYTMGIKIPWTLHDEENWNKTHRMAGFLWVICGILMIITAFSPIPFECFFGIITIAIAVPIVYSFMIYKKNL